MRMRSVRTSVAIAALLASACSPGPSDRSSATFSPSSLPVIVAPDDPSLPYGITAIDYHFHDAHPTRPLGVTRTVLWTNQGSVAHNVTIPAIDFSKDIAVGQTIEIKDLGKKLGGPGVYTFFCKYHAPLGMSGTIIIK
jgi:hypothetical protein